MPFSSEQAPHKCLVEDQIECFPFNRGPDGPPNPLAAVLIGVALSLWLNQSRHSLDATPET
jgi:hypothetical protein